MRWNFQRSRQRSFGERLARGLKRIFLVGGLFAAGGVALGRIRRIENERRMPRLPPSERFRIYADREETRERLRRPGERGPIRSRTAYLFARASGRL